MKTKTARTLSMITAASFLCLSACGVGDDTDVGGQGIRVEKTCLKTARDQCADDQADCRAQISRNCSSCYDTCSSLMSSSYDTSCLSTCDSICNSDYCRSCANVGDSCVEEGFQAVVPDKDPEILTACTAWAGRQRQCGEEWGNCNHYATVEGKHTIPVYECLAAVPCGGDASACGDALPASGFAAEACEAAKGCQLAIGFCDDTTRADRDIFDWWHPATRRGYLACFDHESCSDQVDCLNTFIGVAVES